MAEAATERTANAAAVVPSTGPPAGETATTAEATTVLAVKVALHCYECKMRDHGTLYK